MLTEKPIENSTIAGRHGREIDQGTITMFRRLLLLKGKPVSSDATLGLTYSHDGDLLTVDVGADEQYRIPDALPFGG